VQELVIVHDHATISGAGAVDEESAPSQISVSQLKKRHFPHLYLLL